MSNIVNPGSATPTSKEALIIATMTEREKRQKKLHTHEIFFLNGQVGSEAGVLERKVKQFENIRKAVIANASPTKNTTKNTTNFRSTPSMA